MLSIYVFTIDDIMMPSYLKQLRIGYGDPLEKFQGKQLLFSKIPFLSQDIGSYRMHLSAL